jgi:Zn-dependent protease
MLNFTLFRIPVRVEPFHWLILLFLGSQFHGLSNRSELFYLLVFVAAGFTSILIHELGHALTGVKFGARGTHVVMHGMGGVAIFPQARFSRGQSFLVTAAGPGIQILVGILAWIVITNMPFRPGLSLFFIHLMNVSFFWALLNCIPVWPLDGGQMMAAILGPEKETLTHQISIGAAIFFGLLGFFVLNLLIFPIFLGFMAYQSWQVIQNQKPRW